MAAFNPEFNAEYSRGVGSNQYFGRGVPQGMPLSPLLSTLYLEETILKNQDAVMYADDGLIFTNKPFQHPNRDNNVPGDYTPWSLTEV